MNNENKTPYPPLILTSVNVSPVKYRNTVGVATIVLNGQLELKGLRVIKTVEGKFSVAYPQELIFLDDLQPSYNPDDLIVTMKGSQVGRTEVVPSMFEPKTTALCQDIHNLVIAEYKLTQEFNNAKA